MGVWALVKYCIAVFLWISTLAIVNIHKVLAVCGQTVAGRPLLTKASFAVGLCMQTLRRDQKGSKKLQNLPLVIMKLYLSGTKEIPILKQQVNQPQWNKINRHYDVVDICCYTKDFLRGGGLAPATKKLHTFSGKILKENLAVKSDITITIFQLSTIRDEMLALETGLALTCHWSFNLCYNKGVHCKPSWNQTLTAIYMAIIEFQKFLQHYWIFHTNISSKVLSMVMI